MLRPAVIIFTVKRSLTDRGFLPSVHFARPLELVQGAGSEGGGGRLEVRSLPETLAADAQHRTASRFPAATRPLCTAQKLAICYWHARLNCSMVFPATDARVIMLSPACLSPLPPIVLQLRKTFPLKTLHDVRIYSFARSAAAAAAAAGRSPARSPAASGAGSKSAGHVQQGDPQQQQVLEVRCASHHNLPEHRGQYVMPDMEAACFLVSLALQLLR